MGKYISPQKTSRVPIDSVKSSSARMHLFGRLSKKRSPKRVISPVGSQDKMVTDASQYECYPIQPRYPADASDGYDGLNRRVFLRQNIDQWSSKKSNKKQVDLFIMALDKMQKRDPKDRLSYFQIAGIVASNRERF